MSDTSSDADINEFIGLEGVDTLELGGLECSTDDEGDDAQDNSGWRASTPLYSLREVEVCVLESNGPRLRELLDSVRSLEGVDFEDGVVQLQVGVLEMALDVSEGRYWKAIQSPLVAGVVAPESSGSHTVSRVKNRMARFLHDRVVQHIEKGIGECPGRSDFRDPTMSSPEVHVNQRVLRGFSTLLLGVACLQLFVQANYTGPTVEDSLYPLPYVRGVYDKDKTSKTEFLEEALSTLSADARAKAAATGKHVQEMDLDPFPALHARCALMLGANGEELYRDARYVHLLHTGRIIIRSVLNPTITPGAVDPIDMLDRARLEEDEPDQEGDVANQVKAKPFQELISGNVRQAVAHIVSSPWWSARSAVVHQESLESQEFAAPSLTQETEQGFEKALKALEKSKVSAEKAEGVLVESAKNDEAVLLARLWCERGVAMHKLKYPEKAKVAFAKAQAHAGLSVKLSGALGKRTKFQKEEKSQLILLASSNSTTMPAREKESEESSTREKDTPETTAKEEAAGDGEEGQEQEEVVDNDWGIAYGKEKVIGVSTVRLEELDEHTPLHERIQYAKADTQDEELQRFGTLSLVDQSIVLGLCMDVKDSYAMEALTAEEMLAYAERIAVSAQNWQIYSCALLVKSQLEFQRNKTKERSVLQMQVLVDQQSNRLTPLQTRQEEIDNSAPVEDRLRWVYGIAWPPLWGLKRELASRYLEMGVAGSALKIYEEIHMWEEAVDCLVVMDRRARAEKLIQERLQVHPTANLMCVLGSLKQDPEWYKKAWEFSGKRYARAKRMWAVSAFDAGEYEACVKHLRDALAINPLFPGSWFRLGTAAMRMENWNEARIAFATVIKQEPEEGDAYANLSSVLVKLGDLRGALNAITGAVRHSRNNPKIWDNYVTLSMDTKEWGNVLNGISHLVELRRKVDIQAFILVIDAIITLDTKVSKGVSERQLLGRSTEGEVDDETYTEAYLASLKNQLVELFANIKANCSSDQNVWKAMSLYYSHVKDHANKRECLLRRVRALQKEDAWERDESKTDRIIMVIKDLFQTFVKDVSGQDETLDEEGKRQVKKEAISLVQSTLNRILSGTLPEAKGDPLRELLKEGDSL